MQAAAPALGRPFEVALGTPEEGLGLLQSNVLEAARPRHLLPWELLQLGGKLDALQRADSTIVRLDALPH
eukprot:1295881-Lingulodinium_polyedra.AAC.1